VPACGEELRAVRCGRARAACGGLGSGVGRAGGGREKTMTVTTVEVESTAYGLRLVVCYIAI